MLYYCTGISMLGAMQTSIFDGFDDGAKIEICRIGLYKHDFFLNTSFPTTMYKRALNPPFFKRIYSQLLRRSQILRKCSMLCGINILKKGKLI